MKNIKRKYRMHNAIQRRKELTPNVTVDITDVSHGTASYILDGDLTWACPYVVKPLYPGTVLSFRAGCSHDIHAFEGELNELDIKFTRTEYREGPRWPDVDVEYTVLASLEHVKAITSELIDSHVMTETMRECPLSENPLTR